jgi:cytosine/adenosine deaminase-related metal-dependent hydrolase
MILLKNCYYVATFNDAGDELWNQDILVEGNVIRRIASNITLTREQKKQAEVIDCSHLLVMPGMVNTHHHLYQTLTRNLPGAQDAKLFDWLVHLYPIWANVDEEAVYYSTLLGTAELLKTGATCTTDHMYLYPANFKGDMMDIQFQAAARSGIRFSPSRGSMTLGQSRGGLPPDHVVQATDEVLRDMARVIEAFHDPSPLAMRRVTLAPCSPFSVDDSVMVETARLARSYGVMLHTHLVETKDEEEYCLNKYGLRPLALMEKWGWLGRDVYYAHGIYFDDRELDVLRDTGTGVAHCPTSNMRLGSGVARVKEMLERGVRVGLAVDGSASNDSSDMLGEARNALLLQRVQYGPDALSARAALRLATRGGADLLGFQDGLGQIAEGMGADLALFDLSHFQYAGALSDPVAAIVFCGYNHQVTHTIVNGKVVVRNGTLTDFDEGELVSKFNQIAHKLITR